MNSEELIRYFERTRWVIDAQTKGLTHADSLLRLADWDNNLNWVIGHIVHYRNLALNLFGLEPVLSPGETAVYQRDSEPLADPELAKPMSDLLAALGLAHERLIDSLRGATADTLSAVHDVQNKQTVGDRLTFFLWHETYHVGQLELLRQLAGKSDKII